MTKRIHLPSLLFTAAAVMACSQQEMATGDDSDTDDTGGHEGIFTVTNADDNDDDDEDDANSFDESGSESATTGFNPMPSLNCDKIDFVFVIDNSRSMTDEQQFLADAVPGFVDAMRNEFPTIESLRVGVVDTDSYPGVGSLESPLDGCPTDGTVDCTSCDYQLGAFLTKPNSATDPSATCSFTNADGTPTEASFMDGTSATFADEFACAAIVGADGNPIEQQVSALLASVDPAMSADDACNAGFLRDDALLVFLMITDEEDDHKDPPDPQGGSVGEPPEWFASVLAAKDDKPTNVVALGLIGGSPRFPDCTALSADGKGAEQSSRLESFLGSFETNFIGSVCTEGYDGFFATALEKVAEGCTNFIP